MTCLTRSNTSKKDEMLDVIARLCSEKWFKKAKVRTWLVANKWLTYVCKSASVYWDDVKN